MKDWLLLICVVIIAFFAYREWKPASLTSEPVVALSVPTPRPVFTPAPPDAHPLPASVASPPLPRQQQQPTDDSKTQARLVAESRRLAVATYPALAVAGSEMNLRFVARFKALVAEGSERLRQPDWPMWLAKESVSANGATAAIPLTQTSVASPAAPSKPLTPTINGPRRHSLTFEAQSVANGGTAHFSGDTVLQTGDAKTVDGGTPVETQVLNLHDQQDTGNRTNLRVTIHNLARSADTVRLEWYFVAVPVGDTARQRGSRDFIFDEGSQDVSVQSNLTETRLVSSKELQSILTRSSISVSGVNPSTSVTFEGGFDTVSSRRQSGYKMRGWFVRLLDSGKVIASRGSSTTFEEIAADDQKLRELKQPPSIVRP